MFEEEVGEYEFCTYYSNNTSRDDLSSHGRRNITIL